MRKPMLLAGFLAAGATLWIPDGKDIVSAQTALRFSGLTSSQPIALSADDWLLAVANPDNNTVSIFDVRNGANTRVAQVPVGIEPNGVAVSPDGTRIYVANTVSGTVSVLAADRSNLVYGTGITTIPVGTEPYGIALTPSGRKLYVANARSNSVSVIDTSTNQVVKTITDAGIEPRGIAITNNGGPDSAETVFVTQFLSPPAPGTDDAKTGRVTVISAATDTVTLNGAQTNATKRFITQSWAMAFKHSADEVYVISAASNIVIKLKVDPVTGAPSVQSDPTDTTRVLEIPTGKNPRGIVVAASDKVAYVMNYVSRDVMVIDLTGNVEKVTATLQSESLPTPGTQADKIHIGKELYSTSIGEFDPATAGGPAITGRLSAAGWAPAPVTPSASATTSCGFSTLVRVAPCRYTPIS